MKQEYLPVRLSHLFSHCSVGAIVRGPRYLMTIKDISHWTDKHHNPAGNPILYVQGVCSALGIERELREPPIAQELDNGRIDGVCVPAIRFPEWSRCPECGLLYFRPWKGQQGEEKPRCREEDGKKCSQPELEQVSWVMIHREGHMNDLPWHFLAHMNSVNQNQRQCGEDRFNSVPYLKLTGDSSSQRLTCTRCGAAHKFPPPERLAFKGKRQPWIAEPPEEESPMPAEILRINDTRIHSPARRNALVIPPESRIKRGTVVDRLYTNSGLQKEISRKSTPLGRKSALRRAARSLGCTVEKIKRAMDEIAGGYPLYGKNISHGRLLEEEYKALIEKIPNMSDSEDFVTRHQTGTWKKLGDKLGKNSRQHKIFNLVDNLIAVSRLKEIMVFEGFQRKAGRHAQEEKDFPLVPPDIIGKSPWLPALELYGEGIFFTIAEAVLNRWEKLPALNSRTDDFFRRFAVTGLHFEPEIQISPRFILLHTLSHLLIRQLETKAGYPAASLKERIYCTAGQMPMAGILVYVAVPDIAGSLGGLTELAAPERFIRLLTNVFDHAEWCSLDPVCSEHEGQGPNLLNRAACHGCALIPEPGCAYGNVLLDRIFIKGDESSAIPGFLNFTR